MGFFFHNDDDEDDDVKPVSRAEKARLYRKRIEALERRQRELCPPAKPVRPPREEYWQLPTDMDDEDEESDFIECRTVVALLRSMERHRQELKRCTAQLNTWCEGSVEFADTYDEFTRAGGVSADDFERFMDGRFRARRIRQKRHLRLVASNKTRR